MRGMALPLSPEAMQAALAGLAHDPLLPAYVLVAFVVAGALFISAWLLIAQVAVLFAPAVAIPLALGGALLSASTFYGVGKLLGARAVKGGGDAEEGAAIAHAAPRSSSV